MAEGRLKIVVSDLHMGTGIYAEDGRWNYREDFVYDRLFGQFLRFYSTGDYAQAEVELVLNGDVFELLNPHDYAEGHPLHMTASVAVLQLERIKKGHPIVFAELGAFASRTNKSIRFLPGNHDRALVFDEVRDHLREQIHPDLVFSDTMYEFDGVRVEHGDRYSLGTSFVPGGELKTLEDGTTIINHDWAAILIAGFFLAGKRREYYAFYNTTPVSALLGRLWRYNPVFLLKYLLSLAVFFVQMWLQPRKHELDNWYCSWPLFKYAFGENLPRAMAQAARYLLENEATKIVILGHLHSYRYRVWNKKIYINTGCWTRLVNLSLNSLGSWTKLCYALVQCGSGIPTVTLKEWKGIPVPDATLYPWDLEPLETEQGISKPVPATERLP